MLLGKITNNYCKNRESPHLNRKKIIRIITEGPRKKLA